VDKSWVMAMGGAATEGEGTEAVNYRGVDMKWVSEFKYLGLKLD
jgi:hypothetical protein